MKNETYSEYLLKSNSDEILRLVEHNKGEPFKLDLLSADSEYLDAMRNLSKQGKISFKEVDIDSSESPMYLKFTYEITKL